MLPHWLFLNWKEFEEALDDNFHRNSRDELLIFKAETLYEITKGVDHFQMTALNEDAKRFSNGESVLDIQFPSMGRLHVERLEEIDLGKACLWDLSYEFLPVVDKIYTIPNSGPEDTTLVLGFFSTRRISRPIDHNELQFLFDVFGKGLILVWILNDNNFQVFECQPQMLGERVLQVRDREYLPIPQFKVNFTEIMREMASAEGEDYEDFEMAEDSENDESYSEE